MNSEVEEAYARCLVQHLRAGRSDVDPQIAAALAAARQRALSAADRPRSTGLRVKAWPLPYAAVAVLLLVGVGLAWLSPQLRPLPSEPAEMDLLLLTGELPPYAYLDQDFPAWPDRPGLCRS